MGVAHHAAYLVWFEAARTEYLRSLGFSYRFMEGSGLFLPVVESLCRYRDPVTYDDVLKISTRLQELRRVRITLAYRACKENDTLSAEGYTVHALLNREGKPIPFPADLRAALLAALESTK